LFSFPNYIIAVYMKEPFITPLATCSTKKLSHWVRNVDDKKGKPIHQACQEQWKKAIHPSVPNIEGVRVILGQVGSEAHLVKNKIPKIAKLNEIKLRVSSVKSGAGDGWMCWDFFCVWISMCPPCWQCVHQVPMCSFP
jgi:hypothetical protein